jgi:replication fork protection complex subunit Csm3/Swi3
MNLLDDIWDEPVEASATPNPPKEALFLAGSDDEDDIDGPNSQRHAQKAPADIDMETVEAIFAGVNDENEDAFTFKPLAPSLDTEALRREAESRHKNKLPSFTPHAILPSSSPPRDTGDGRDGFMKDRGGEKQKDAKKDRRKPARLDERRLLGPTGFPQLIKDTKDFRTKGKGHEVIPFFQYGW